MAENDPPPQRYARIVLVTPAGAVIGALPPIPIATPWWQDIGPVVAAVRMHHGLDVAILRLLDTERDRMPGGLVTYLAETTAPALDATPWSGTLTDHPLRQPYAKPGGPAADLIWATEVLAARGLTLSGPPAQVRTWNLSSLWRLPVASGDAWLKAVPSFFAHEGAMLDILAGEPVPHLLGRDGRRVVLAAVPGEDLYDAQLPTLLRMIELLVSLQRKFLGRTGELLALGLPDWRTASLTSAIARAFERNRRTLTADDAATLSRFVDRLPERFAEIAACGIPDTLVHGDFHPGNLRGDGATLTLLDWGDSGVGHPLLDQAAFLDRVPKDAVVELREHWRQLWQSALPGTDPERAANLLAPIAAARQAIIYQAFLDGIEPSEQVYHRHDPANWLRATAARLG
jgi:hypothetical protein